ncbi:MAG: DUF4105 domain-containing protein [Myxococcales bacterium]
MRWLRAWFLVVFVMLTSSAALAEPGDELTISLLTMGPGEHPFTKFGHTAIWVHDAQRERDEIYNYGTFSFDSPTALLDSVAGKLPYWLSAQSLEGTLLTYRDQGRSLVASELELSAVQRSALYEALRENERPEHRYYRYDYFRDNCATRVRDVIDRVLDGRIHDVSRTPASMSYREHMLRLLAEDPALYAGLDVAVGRQSDVPITFWDEAFLPQKLHDLLAATRVPQGSRELPLIRNERVLLKGHFPAPRATPPRWGAFYVALGLLFGAAFAGLGLAARRSRTARVALGIAYSGAGAALGLLGCALCYLTFFSAHSAAASNYNVLLVPPWALALAVAGIGVARRSSWGARWAFRAASAALASSGIALLLLLVMNHAQANGQDLALALPLWLGASFAAWQRGGHGMSAPGVQLERSIHPEARAARDLQEEDVV